MRFLSGGTFPEFPPRSTRERFVSPSEVRSIVGFPSLDDLRKHFEPVEIAAVNQCSGNSRGLFAPRVTGGEWQNGAMGNALWKGARLKDILAKAGLKADAKQV